MYLFIHSKSIPKSNLILLNWIDDNRELLLIPGAKFLKLGFISLT